MRSSRLASGLALVLAGTAAIADTPRREMNVTQGPETVFGVPAAEVLPELRDATPTGINGRVGPEFVFWGYRRAPGEEVWMYACPVSERIDCAARKAAICDGAMRVITETTRAGDAVDRRCRSISVAGIGDRRPGCTQREVEAQLLVGIATCG